MTANSRANAPKSEQPRQEPPGQEELKNLFRAALERKRRQSHDRSVLGHGPATPKVHERARRAGGKRTFRRKSG